jgi:phosphatidate cytidylyltransferase
MVVALPAVALLLSFAPPAVVALVVALASTAMAFELAGLLAAGASARVRGTAAGAATLLMWALWSVPASVACLYFAAVVTVLAIALRLTRPGATPIAWAIAALAGTTPFAAALLHRDAGIGWTALLLTVTWGGDTAGYLVGRLAGGPRLAPRVSPRKTIAGGAATLATGLAAGWAFGAYSTAGLGPAAPLVGLAAAALAITGDLAGSLAKRRAGVEHSGRLLPGHGGALDVLDGMTLAAPFLCAVAVVR